MDVDLPYNPNPAFTRRIIKNGLLSSPLVVIDVGVYGGIHPRWQSLGPMLEIHGFDAREEAIAPLRKAAGRNEHYYAMALGNEDGDRTFFVSGVPAGSSFYAPGPSVYDVSPDGTRLSEQRVVPIRRLDTLLREGTFAGADFIKIDCEGFEPEILKGAAALLESGVIGVEIETNFGVSPILPNTHFFGAYQHLVPFDFRLYNLVFNRVPRASFAERMRSLGIANAETLSWPATFNVLFYRDQKPRSRDELLKRAIILELYGMNDIAYDELMGWPGYTPPQDLSDLLIVPSARPAPPPDPLPPPGPRHHKNIFYSLGIRTRLRRLLSN